MTFKELRQDKRVQERLKGACPEGLAHICPTWECDTCIKLITLDWLWQWWCEINACGTDWQYVWDELNRFIANPQCSIKYVFESLEHALLLAILKRVKE